MNFDDMMGSPYMTASAKRYGCLMLTWIATIEVLKAAVNRMESKRGKTKTQWFTIHGDKKRFLSDGCVIKIFNDLCTEGGIPDHEAVVQCLNAALCARHQLVHRLGEMITEYLLENQKEILENLSRESIADGSWAKPLAEKVEREIRCREPAIATACNSVKSFAEKTL